MGRGFVIVLARVRRPVHDMTISIQSAERKWTAALNTVGT